MKPINGRGLAAVIKDTITDQIQVFGGTRPGLAIILVGDRPDSSLYVGLKEKQAKSVGIDTHLYRCDEDITEKQLLEIVDFLNADEEIDAILIQLPLPTHLTTDTIVNRIKPEKDVDGFTAINLKRLMTEEQGNAIMPPVYGVIFAMLESINVSLSNAHVVLIANSDIFEKNLAEIVRRQGAVVELLEPNQENLTAATATADILITAIGNPHYITAEMIQPGAVIIDIGIATMPDGTVLGDVNPNGLEEVEGYITPVPGGVGPMTIAMAFWNTLEMFKKNRQL